MLSCIWGASEVIATIIPVPPYKKHTANIEIEYLFVTLLAQFQDDPEIQVFFHKETQCCQEGVWIHSSNPEDDRGNDTSVTVLWKAHNKSDPILFRYTPCSIPRLLWHPSFLSRDTRYSHEGTWSRSNSPKDDRDKNARGTIKNQTQKWSSVRYTRCSIPRLPWNPYFHQRKSATATKVLELTWGASKMIAAMIQKLLNRKHTKHHICLPSYIILIKGLKCEGFKKSGLKAGACLCQNLPRAKKHEHIRFSTTP